ncbi:MAG: DNA mismatch repair protein MutS [Pseudomonadota bacterium]
MSKLNVEKNSNLTPMMKQYWEIKKDYQDAILFFRLGDFYEMFSDDAILASKVLNIALTTRNKNSPNPVPLCGVPHHSAKSYISKLVNSGLKVAICDQIEDPKLATGIVKRQVQKVISPGLLDDFLEINAEDNNFILSLFIENDTFSISFIDYSIGRLKATYTKSEKLICDEIEKIDPKEVIIYSDLKKLIKNNKLLRLENTLRLRFVTFFENEKKENQYDANNINPIIQNIQNLEEIRDIGLGSLLSASKLLLKYIVKQRGEELTHISKLSYYEISENMILDNMTIKNLEILSSLTDGKKINSLVWAIDKTKTSMGARLLKDWLRFPLRFKAKIEKRQDAVADFYKKRFKSENIQKSLESIYDLERINAKISTKVLNPRDLVHLKTSMALLPKIKDELLSFDSSDLIKEIYNDLDPCEDVYNLIDQAIIDDPPITITEGGIFKKGYHQKLDELNEIEGNSRNILLQMEASQRQSTGINSLKIRYNKVFGYYIEVTKANISQVPDHYIRKQTLVNQERYITPELKELEDKILNASSQRKEVEHEEFSKLRNEILKHNTRIQKTAHCLSKLDLLISFALTAIERKYVKPKIIDDKKIIIKEGRHPVVELTEACGRFIPNDIEINDEEKNMIILTGPNMAGKSTLMRQVALITLLAHIGSFVPADSAEIGVADRIFTRIGASDNLAGGESTFMVEMRETATILSSATSESLIIMDEIGRGTSTFDGISIAWACAEYIHDKIKARTLFATHYHELTQIDKEKDKIANFNIGVKEFNDEIIFIRKLFSGPASMSYGIQVARLAGIPDEVIFKAKEILAGLESGDEHKIKISPASLSNISKRYAKEKKQLSLFNPVQDDNYNLLKLIKEIDINNITPMEALNILAELNKKVNLNE